LKFFTKEIRQKMVESRPKTWGPGSGGGSGGGDDPNRNNNNNNNNSWSSMGSDWDLSTILSMKDVSDKTRAHLTRVYTTLLTASGTCAVGMYMNATLMLSGFIFMILFMVAFGWGVYQIRSPHNSENI